MKKILSFVLLFILFCSIRTFAAPKKQWDKSYGTTNYADCSSIVRTSDGGYVIAGGSPSDGGDKTENGKGESDYWIIKVNEFGDIEWDKTYGGVSNDYPEAIIQTSDGGYVIVGTSWSPAGADKSDACRGWNDYWLVKLAADGSKEWDRTYGGAGDDYAWDVCQTGDGGYAIAGRSYSGITGDKSEANLGSKDYWIVKVNTNGTVIEWDKTYGGSDKDNPYSIQQTIDGGYIVAGDSYSTNDGNKGALSHGSWDCWVVKLAANGNKEGDISYGGTNDDYVVDIKQTDDGGYIFFGGSDSPVGGNKTSAGIGEFDFWLVKITSDGSNEWDRSYGGTNTEMPGALCLDDDGGYVLTGSSMSGKGGDKTEENNSTTFGFNDYWIVKVGADGTKYWDKSFGGASNDMFMAIDKAHDGGYVAVGSSISGISGDKTDASAGMFDIWLVKFFAFAKNDYDGDSVSDQAVFDNNGGYWYIKTVDGSVITWTNQWGWPGATPVHGDYDGDGRSDLAVFDTADGYWYIKTVDGSVITWTNQWGWSTALPVPGDYDGDAVSDQAVFDTVGGNWYIKTVAGSVITWTNQWGWSSAVPVPGDYDGDGVDDLAVFDTADGYWYIKSLSGSVITWTNQWGWAGAVPVAGDYDGDGRSDLAVFDTADGYWYVKSLDGSVIAWAEQWGWAGAVTVSGDYDGDGVDDLAVFDTANGYWYIKSLNGSVITWTNDWGWAGADVVGAD